MSQDAEIEDAATVWRCQEEVARLMDKVKPFKEEMEAAAERLKSRTGARQAGNFLVTVESKTRQGYAVLPGAVVSLKVKFSPVVLEAVPDGG